MQLLRTPGSSGNVELLRMFPYAVPMRGPSFMNSAGHIRVGIGGWDYAPWRETFYPPGVTQKRQLEYASRQVTAIEVNGTFYGLQKPTTFARWRDETPEGFVFSLKAPRFVTHRRELATAGESIQRFMDSGIAELGAKLGPILWQLPPTTKFDVGDVERFLKLLPANAGDLRMRHALEARHDSFIDAAFVQLARRYNMAIVLADSAKYPAIAAMTADFVYVRLMKAVATEPTGYQPQTLSLWADRARQWAAGAAPSDLPMIETEVASASAGRDVFMYAINGAKERAPAAAMRLLSTLGLTPSPQLFAMKPTADAAANPGRKTSSKKAVAKRTPRASKAARGDNQ
jgi:uncharacterized protein YecE (DUF72 family)